MLPEPGDDSKPRSGHAVKNRWLAAEVLAGIEPVKGTGWHSLRRTFATEMTDVPLKDLGCRGTGSPNQTILKCYQQPEEETMRTALEQRRRLGKATDR